MTVTIRTQKLTLAQCRQYVKQNATKQSEGFWTVKNDLKVWKATTSVTGQRSVVALRIPEGAEVFMQKDDQMNYRDARKMRASRAFVEKQFLVGSRIDIVTVEDTEVYLTYQDIYEINESRSANYSDFLYGTGKFVIPNSPFSTQPKQCASGIHFFVNLYDALTY